MSGRVAVICYHGYVSHGRAPLSSHAAPQMNEPLGAISPLRRETLGDQVHMALRDLLAAGQMAPGERFSLRSVSESLGVSVMPVREAVTRLVAEGALEVLPSRTVRVPEMTLGKFRELTIVRKAVEGFAAERAASARSADELEAIRRHEVAFRNAATAPGPDLHAAIRANRDFHFAVYAAAGLPTLTAIIEGLWLRIGPVLNFDLRASPERLSEGGAKGCHHRLARAIAAGDGPAARRALTDDIETAAVFIERTGRLPQEERI